ncbi:MAG: tyrosine-protein phosphatase [Acidobacteriota bacterium]
MQRSSLKKIYNAIPKFKAAAISAPLLILAFAIYSFAPSNSSIATNPSKSFANVTIKNFGQMDEHFYRGAQPKDDEYKELADLGVEAIIDLRDDPMPFAKSAVEGAKMRYFNIPMSDKDYPKDETIDEFLKISKEESNWPFYVHCAGGRHRTGLMGAMYRFNHDGWDYNKAYQEMKNYDFYTRWGHGEIKKYVEDYWQHFQAKTPLTSASVSAQSTQ